MNTLLAEMDGIEEMQSVVVIGATNRPESDRPRAAAPRPARRADLCDCAGCRRGGGASSISTPAKCRWREDVDLAVIADKAKRFTGADLEDLTRRAGMVALRRSMDVTTVTMADFTEALKDTRATVTPEMEKDYEKNRRRNQTERRVVEPDGVCEPRHADTGAGAEAWRGVGVGAGDCCG